MIVKLCAQVTVMWRLNKLRILVVIRET